MSIRCSVARVWLVLAGAAMGALVPQHRSPGADMSAAAGRFLATLSAEQRARAGLAFDGKERLDWSFVPRERAGVKFGEMSDAQRMAARELVRSGLSSRGVGKVEQIMRLDGVLKEMEREAGGAGAMRDPLGYVVAVFGTPGGNEPWAWRFEGHHVSVSFTVTGAGVAVTPEFFGANPAEVRRGPMAGVRVLAAEEDVARELLNSLDAGQRKDAVISDTAPNDVLSMPGRSLDEVDSAGLAYGVMNAAQRALVDRLLAEYAGNLRLDLADAELARIRGAGMDKVRFAWAGAAERGHGHYYRLSGPTFVIEYDNTQNNANHVHTVWHDRERDFGRDVLREHIERGK